MTEKAFIELIKPWAKAAMARYGLPASIFAGVPCVETGYGSGPGCAPLVNANNICGMKTDLLNETWTSKYWHGEVVIKLTPEYRNGKKVMEDHSFRAYESMQDCIFDFAQFLTEARYSVGGPYKYRDVAQLKDPEQIIKTIAGRGWCTDPEYAEKVMEVIRKHNLTELDQEGNEAESVRTIAKSVPAILAYLGLPFVDLIAACASIVPAHNANTHDYLAIHYLGVDRADNPYLYDKGYGGHYYVNRIGTKAYQAALVTDSINHVGANSKNGYKYIDPYARNYNTVGIEIGTYRDDGVWYFKNEAQETAAKLAAAIMLVYNIPMANLRRHGDITTKCCPAPLMPASRSGSEGVGPNWTWERFKARVQAVMDQIRPLLASGSVSNILKRGATGDAVKQVQSDLISLGYSCGSCGADGIFGLDTVNAVESFQAANGLEVDGEVGPLTQAAIKKAVEAAKPDQDVIRVRVQCGAFGSRENAERLIDALHDADFPAGLEDYGTDAPEGTRWHVQVGAYQDELKANELAKRVIDAGFKVSMEKV